eukprot:6204380-Pleurochrysis_carterae.AAC.2
MCDMIVHVLSYTVQELDPLKASAADHGSRHNAAVRAAVVRQRRAARGPPERTSCGSAGHFMSTDTSPEDIKGNWYSNYCDHAPLLAIIYLEERSGNKSQRTKEVIACRVVKISSRS